MEIIRGNTKYFKFQRKYKHTQEVIEKLPDNLYFTIKYSDNTDDVLIQKKLNAGIEYNNQDNYYYITIDFDDTENLPYGKYYFDIKVIKNTNYKQTIARGELEITSQITRAINEV